MKARTCVCVYNTNVYTHVHVYIQHNIHIMCKRFYMYYTHLYAPSSCEENKQILCVCAVQSQILVPHPLTSAGSYLHPKFPLGWTNIDVENTLVSLRKWPINVASPHLFLQFSLQGVCVCVCFNLGLLWMADPKKKKNMCHCSSRNQWVCLQSEKIQELWSWKSLTLQ